MSWLVVVVSLVALYAACVAVRLWARHEQIKTNREVERALGYLRRGDGRP